MRLGAEVDGIGIVRVFDDFFLASSGFDGDRNDSHKLKASRNYIFIINSVFDETT